MNWKVLTILSVVNIIYIILGGIIFHFLEQPQETSTRSAARNITNDFLNKFPCANSTDLELFIVRIIKAYDAGILATNNASGPSNWDIQSAIFFSGTVVTTIGYGHIAPVTRGGRLFCAFFALFGVPMFGVMLVHLGSKLNEATGKIDKIFVCGIFKKRPKVTKYCRVLLQITTALLLFLFIPAVIFFVIEDWTYSESLYYAFITLTTIGFGDFVAGTNADEGYRGWYRLCLVGWIIIGLSIVAMGISGVQELIDQHFQTNANKVLNHSASKDKDTTDGDEETEPAEEAKEETDPDKV